MSADSPKRKRRKPGPTQRQRRKCKAKTTAGAPCRNYAITGGTVCGTHGGRAPQTKAAAARRAEAERLERAARQAALKAGLLDPDAGDVDPLRILTLELGRAGAMARLYGSAVAELLYGEGSLYIPPDDDDEEGRGHVLTLGDHFLARLALYDKAPVILSLYGEERDRHARLGKLVIDAGLAERLVAVEEAVITQLETALDAALVDAGFDHAAQAKVRRALGAQLELIEGGKTA